MQKRMNWSGVFENKYFNPFAGIQNALRFAFLIVSIRIGKRNLKRSLIDYAYLV